MKWGVRQTVILILSAVLLAGMIGVAVAAAPGAAPAYGPYEIVTLKNPHAPTPLPATVTRQRDVFPAVPSPGAETDDQALQRFWEVFGAPDFSPLYESMHPNVYHRFADVWDVLERMGAEFTEAVRQAAAAAASSEALCVANADVSVDLSWRQLAGLYYVYGTRLHTFLAENLQIAADAASDAVTLRVSLPDFFALAQLGEPNDAYRARTVYFYLNTVFTDEGQVRPELYDEPELPSALMDRLVSPLAYSLRKFVRNTWGAGRAKNSRMHMGTDIRIKQVEIYSCSAGTVLFSGFNTVSGNYVCVADEAGYEYQYMHMRELSPFVKPGDRVEAGQQIGWVGNTGNSVANHLHFSMIAPEGKYINTYYVVHALMSRDVWKKS